PGARRHDQVDGRGARSARQRQGRYQELSHLARQGVRRRRHAARAIADRVGYSRRPPSGARGRRIPDGIDQPAALGFVLITAGTASPSTSTRLTSGSLPGGLPGPVPNSDSEPVGWLVSGTTGPATGRGAGPPAFGRAPAAGVCGSSGAGIASGAPRASITRLI